MTDIAGLRPVQTATFPDTIWLNISEPDFRHSLVALEKRTNAVPMDVLTVAVEGNSDSASTEGYLPLKIEKQVADDMAFIAAVSEGAQSVAAVCVEQHISRGEHGATLLLKVAGMDIVEDNVKSMLQRIAEILQEVSQSTDRSDARDGNVFCESIFRLIITQHKQKLLGRLRSKKWTKPTYLGRTHKKCLWQDFDNVLHRVQHIYPKRSERRIREATTGHLKDLSQVYALFELSTTDTESALQSLVKATYTFCRQAEIRAYAAQLERVSVTPQIGAARKTLRQLEKIGAYWRIATDLYRAAQNHPSSFARIQLEYIRPYASVPTNITYESWAGKCHVHAEVQLVVEYALQAENEAENDPDCTIIKPRTIGTSKYLCYLCYLFLHYHGGFQALSTHGRLYDQWTVPDLVEYSADARQKLATVIEQMSGHVRQQIDDTPGTVWRAEPMTSRQNLICCADVDEGFADATEAVEQELRRLAIG